MKERQRWMKTRQSTVHGTSKKKKKIFVISITFRDILLQILGTFRMAVTRPKNGRKKFHSPNFFSKFIQLFDAPEWVAFAPTARAKNEKRKRRSKF